MLLGGMSHALMWVRLTTCVLHSTEYKNKEMWGSGERSPEEKRIGIVGHIMYSPLTDTGIRGDNHVYSPLTDRRRKLMSPLIDNGWGGGIVRDTLFPPMTDEKRG